MIEGFSGQMAQMAEKSMMEQSNAAQLQKTKAEKIDLENKLAEAQKKMGQAIGTKVLETQIMGLESTVQTRDKRVK